eukprot:scaffold58020_cov47-Phaeocystis_antarctica.AAC.1
MLLLFCALSSPCNSLWSQHGSRYYHIEGSDVSDKSPASDDADVPFLLHAGPRPCGHTDNEQSAPPTNL